MKKVVSILILASLIVPVAALAQPRTGCILAHDITGFSNCTLNASVNEVNGPTHWGMCCILDAVMTVTDWVFYVLMIVAALLVIWGGFTIATAGGAPEKVSSGRSYIMFALLGLAIALLSRAIPAVVMGLI